MAVQARFWVTQVNKQAVAQGNAMVTVVLNPVTRKTDDNIQWAKYTPSGKIEMSISAEGGQQWFEDRLGKDIAITFEDAAE